jgi:hypothetical protein
VQCAQFPNGGIARCEWQPLEDLTIGFRDERSGRRTQDDADGEDHANPHAQTDNRLHCMGIRFMCDVSTIAKTAASPSKTYKIQKSRSAAKNK